MFRPQWVEIVQMSTPPKSETQCVSPGENGAMLLSGKRIFQVLHSSLALPCAGLRVLLRQWAFHPGAGQHFTDHNCRYAGQGPVGSVRLTEILAFLPFPSFLCFSTAAERGSDSFPRVVSSVCHFALISCEDINETVLEQFREDLVKWNNLHQTAAFVISSF